MIEGWIWDWIMDRLCWGRKPSVTDKEQRTAQSYKEWLELNVVEREKRKAAMTDEERKKLKASEVAYYDQQDNF